MTHTATISSKGQITLPAEFRRQLNLKEGDKITIVKRANFIEIAARNWRQDLDELHQQVAQHLQANRIRPLTDEELDEAINESATKATAERYGRGTV